LNQSHGLFQHGRGIICVDQDIHFSAADIVAAD